MTERTRTFLAQLPTGRCCASARSSPPSSWWVPRPAARRPRPARPRPRSGVVQSTVSGSGNLQPASQLNLGFKTSGTVTTSTSPKGSTSPRASCWPTLDPQSAEVTLEQAKATLQSAEANLAKEEETDGESSTGSSGSTGAGGNAQRRRGLDAPRERRASAPPARPRPRRPTAERSEHHHGCGHPIADTHHADAPPHRAHDDNHSEDAQPPPAPPRPPGAPKRNGTETTREGRAQGNELQLLLLDTATVSAATREANLASARAAVKSDKLTVQSDEEAVQDTKLYAPEDGTIVSLSGQVGEVVSGERNDQGLEQQQLLGRLGIGSGRGRRRLLLGPLGRRRPSSSSELLRAPPAPRAPRSRYSATSPRCSSWWR